MKKFLIMASINEKHRPSGVDRRVHRKENGKKVSYDYIDNLPKYNKHQKFKEARKFQRIQLVRYAEPKVTLDDGRRGEYISTVLKNGQVERDNTFVQEGWPIVKNVNGPEMWGIDPKTFSKKYEKTEQEGIYKPKGGPMNASQPLKRKKAFAAPWGGDMYMDKGSRILQDPNNPKDTYGIGGKEFDDTYKFVNESFIRKVVSEALKTVLSENFESEYRTKGSLNKKTLEKNAGKTAAEIIADREAKAAEEDDYNPDWDDYSMEHINDLYGGDEEEFDDTSAGGDYKIDFEDPYFFTKDGKRMDADAIGNFHNDFAIVKKGGKVNYVDSNGKLLSDEWFDACNDFEDGFGLVSKGTKRNFVRSDGSLLLDVWVDRAGDFIAGEAPVMIDGKRYRVDRNGNIS